MPVASGNRLLPLVAAVVVLMLIFVGLKSCANDPDTAALMTSVPQAPVPDADTPADTIKTLTANVAAMTAEVEALRQDNATLRSENQRLLSSRNQIEENVTTRLEQKLLSRDDARALQARQEASVLSTLTARVDTLAQSLSQVQPTQAGGDMPVGLGYDNGGAPPADRLVWIEPLDTAVEPSTKGKRTGPLQQVRHAAAATLDGARRQTKSLTRRIETPQPVYTVPRNATLIGATTMTALVGRVPIQGEVRDPMPFKVITGADNLAANGLTVPGVQGMVWSGTAIGDWTLSCVSGRLDAVTFVFDDGSIRTLAADGGGRGDRPLGWISDQQGIPCISGARKTNAPAFLTQRMGVSAIQAAADAAAAAQTTSVVGEGGAASHSVTGDSGAYVLGKTLAGGSEALARWLLERQSQSFDAVFVPAGARVAIHVDRELPIDLDHNGRRLHHANAHRPDHHTGLD